MIYLRKKIEKKRCRYCWSTENLTIDHKIPKIQGGKDDIKNLQVLCFRCNGMKSGLSHRQVMRLFDWFADIKCFKKSQRKLNPPNKV